MSNIELGTLSKISVYPIKGFPCWVQNASCVEVDAILPWDRRFAFSFKTKGSKNEQGKSGWLPKRELLQILNTGALSGLKCSYSLSDNSALVLVINRTNGPDLEFDLSDKAGREDFSNHISVLFDREIELKDGLGHAFADQKRPLISLLNMASINDMAQKSARPISWQRLRGNLMIEGWNPWVEDELVGRFLKIGSAQFEVVELTGRCAAPGTDLNGVRDHDLLKFMQHEYGHTDCGLFLSVIQNGTFSNDDAVELV